MKIGIDIMGGDYAPDKTVLGAIKARKQIDLSHDIYLFGDKTEVENILEQNHVDINSFQIVNCTDVIEMGENPAKAFKSKLNSSIVVGYNYLKREIIDGFASAGNTGAMMVGAMHVVKSVPGIIRPGIATTLPKINGRKSILIDVGINPDCRPDVLYQYGILGSTYAQHVFKMNNPRVGLLNIGEEEGKGNLLTKNTFELMKDTTDFNFIGNVEGNDIFNDEKVDVIVCDGFVGNIILKQVEAFHKIIEQREINDDYLNQLNFEDYGSIPILGINKTVTIGHGMSGEEAIKNMIIQTKEVIEANLSDKIKEVFN